MAGLCVSGRHLRTAISGMLSLWILISMFPAKGLPQVLSIPSGGRVPQAMTRDELDAFGAIYDVGDANSTIQAVKRFAQDFPKSQFLEYADMAAMHAYDELGDRRGSHAMAEAILKLNPKNVDALLTLAELIVKEPLGSQDGAAQWNRARDYARQGLAELDRYTLPPLAERKRWLKTKRDFLARGYGILGTVAYAQGHLDEAIGSYAKAADFNPLGEYFYQEGLAFEAQGQFERARMSLSRARDLGPEPVSRLAAGEIDRLRTEEKSQP